MNYYYEMSFQQLRDYFQDCKLYKDEEKFISLMRVGSFYEAYYNPRGEGSGKILSEILHMHLTCKKPSEEWSDKNPKFSGFPSCSLQKHLTRLNDLNYNVKIYEQDDNDKKVRYLKGTYTKNIRMDFDTIDFPMENSSVFSFLIEKYPLQSGNIRLYEYKQYITRYDSSSGKIYFSEMVDNTFQRMIEQYIIQYNPTEMIFFVENLTENEIMEIRNILDSNSCNHIKIQEWKSINHEEVNQMLHRCLYKVPSLEYYPYMSQNLYYLLQYIENHNKSYVKNIIVPDDAWIEMENKMSIPYVHFNRDVFRELFLFQVDEERRIGVDHVKTIFEMLSHGMNPMAKRLLYRILQHPLTSKTEMKERYRKIRENELSKKIFQGMIDIEYYLLRWRRGTLKENYIGNLFIVYRNLEIYYPDLKEINEYIEEIWDLEKMIKGEMFFKQVDDEYIEWDSLYKKHKNTIQLFYEKELEKGENFKFIEESEMTNSYFQITNNRWNKWSKRKQDHYRIINDKGINKKIMYKEFDNLLFEIDSLKEKMDRYQKNLLNDHKEIIFLKFTDKIEEINYKITNDSLYSVLKSFYEKNGYSCPEIDEDNDFLINVKNIRHSLLEYLHPNKLFVPYSYIMDSQSIGSVIYGMNSSGKSTFMKSIVLALWFAQCGLWVSAESFRFTPMEKIFTKFSHSDNLFKQQSLYVAEISELKYIIERSNKKTFLCLDELTSGTEIHSSSSLILSLFEFFYEKKIPFLFTTHIHFISNYIQNNFKDKICLYHFTLNESRLQKDNVIYTLNINDLYDRELKKGPGPSIYGIEVAEKLGIPKEIIDRSYELRKHIRIDYQEKGNKKSKYNTSLKVEECFRCGSRENLHTHHIFPQKCFDKKEVLENGFRKNGLYNLLILCMTCHEELHHSSK